MTVRIRFVNWNYQFQIKGCASQSLNRLFGRAEVVCGPHRKDEIPEYLESRILFKWCYQYSHEYLLKHNNIWFLYTLLIHFFQYLLFSLLMTTVGSWIIQETIICFTRFLWNSVLLLPLPSKTIQTITLFWTSACIQIHTCLKKLSSPRIINRFTSIWKYSVGDIEYEGFYIQVYKIFVKN